MGVRCVVLVLGLARAVCSADMEKRLLLQSSTDIVQEILTLKAQGATMETELTKLHFAVADRDNKITQLQSTVTRFRHNKEEKVLRTHGGGEQAVLETEPLLSIQVICREPIIRVTWVQYEFWIHATTARDLPDFFGSDIYKNEAPCAVFHSSRASSVMIPGRKDCYPGWTKEYSGYLVCKKRIECF